MALNNLMNSPFPTVVGKGGTGVVSITAHSLIVGNGTSAVTILSAATNGQIPIGSTGADPVIATITAGSGISVTNGAGSITIANTQSDFSTVNQTAATVTMAVNTQYINTSAGNTQVVYTIPATAALGAQFRIVGVTGNSGGWQLQANTGQTVWVGNVACSSAGTWTSGDATDNITFVCTVANTIFAVVSGVTADLTST